MAANTVHRHRESTQLFSLFKAAYWYMYSNNEAPKDQYK